MYIHVIFNPNHEKNLLGYKVVDYSNNLNSVQGIELTKTLLFILKVLWCSNKLMQKQMASTYNYFYLWNCPFESIFQNVCFEIITIFKVLDHPTIDPAISSICFRGPWIILPNCFTFWRPCHCKILGNFFAVSYIKHLCMWFVSKN